MLVVYAAVRFIPPRPPELPSPRPLTLDLTVVQVEFREKTLLNLNTATAAELEKLPGIGPKLAWEIVVYREKYGPFRSVDELLNVPGIGPATLERIRALVTVVSE